MESFDKILLRTLAIAVMILLAFSAVADAKFLDFFHDWPGWDFVWYH